MFSWFFRVEVFLVSFSISITYDTKLLFNNDVIQLLSLSGNRLAKSITKEKGKRKKRTMRKFRMKQKPIKQMKSSVITLNGFFRLCDQKKHAQQRQQRSYHQQKPLFMSFFAYECVHMCLPVNPLITDAKNKFDKCVNSIQDSRESVNFRVFLSEFQ